MLHLEAEWVSNWNILITDTIFADPGFKVWGGDKINFYGERF